jgi:hypothetical protein
MPEERWMPCDPVDEVDYEELKRFPVVREALVEKGVDFKRKQIITSQDPRIKLAREKVVPSGMGRIQEWQLAILATGEPSSPLYTTTGATHAPSTAPPGAELHPYVLEAFSIFRFVAAGSMIWEKLELKQGDWMYVPSGVGCAYKEGHLGAIILHKFFPCG